MATASYQTTFGYYATNYICTMEIIKTDRKTLLFIFIQIHIYINIYIIEPLPWWESMAVQMLKRISIKFCIVWTKHNCFIHKTIKRNKCSGKPFMVAHANWFIMPEIVWSIPWNMQKNYRKVQGVPQSQTTANPQHQEKEKWQKLICLHVQNKQTNAREAQRPASSSPSKVITC